MSELPNFSLKDMLYILREDLIPSFIAGEAKLTLDGYYICFGKNGYRAQICILVWFT